MRRAFFLLCVAAAHMLAACRGAAQRSGEPDRLARLVDSLRAPVEQAVGLRFRAPPRSAVRTPRQVRTYLIAKLNEELPPARMRGIQTAYQLFGLLPDTLQLRGLLLDLYTEQVAGYYDPDSATLFGVSGADPLQLRVVVAHELVHALQGQYLPLDSILHQTRANDRLTAAQAILEGQATLASIRALVPAGQDPTANPQFWDLYRGQIRQQQSAMPVFARAPLVVRESLIFPYLAGAEFMRWWRDSPRADTVPYGPRMPTSTEQILHPDRYLRGDGPVALAFLGDTGVMYEDDLGENELRVLLAHLSRVDQVKDADPLGWGGDRYRVYATSNGPALVWYAVWDDELSARRFLQVAGPGLRAPGRKEYRAALEPLRLNGRPGTRYVLAPLEWDRWGSIPVARLAREG